MAAIARSILLPLAVGVAIALAYHSPLRFPEPLPDEANYVWGFARAAAGQPLYDGGFLSPPILARTGAILVAEIGRTDTLRLLRLANVIGLTALLWLGLAPLRLEPAARAILVVTLAITLPGAQQGMYWGNLSLATTGLIVAGLAARVRHPVLGGVLVGASVALKPLAPVAMLVLLCHRPKDGLRRSAVVATVTAAGVAAALLLLPGGLGQYLARADLALSMRSASWHRLLYLAGVEVAPLAVLSVVAVLAVWVVRRRTLDDEELRAAACAAALAATPLVWNHTLLLAVPVAALAVRTLVLRRGFALARPYETALVVLGVAACAFAEGVTGVYDYPIWLQVMAVLPPAFAPVALCVYSVSASREPVVETVLGTETDDRIAAA